MITDSQLDAQPGSPARPKRSSRSLAQQYREYIMQRIEDYKDSIPRMGLLQLGDEAVAELQAGPREQLVLTEVLIQETVDQQIVKRLRLPSYRKWRAKIHPLREAQRDPTHWQIEHTTPVASVLPRLEFGDRALVVGGGAERAVYLLAAHDVEVVGLFEDTATADKVEGILGTEGLGARCTIYVSLLGRWIPPLPEQHLVVLDARAVMGAPRERQEALARQLQAATAPGGLHAVVSPDPRVAPEGCLHLYPDWQRRPLPPDENAPKGRGLGGVLLSGPPAHAIPQSAYVRPAV